MLGRGSSQCSGPVRVLHLVHGLNLGGIEKWLLATLLHMPRSQFAMDICYKGPREGELAPLARASGAEVFPCPLGPLVFPFICRLKAILQSRSYSLLHVHTHAHSGPAVYAANATGIPVVTTFHSTERKPQTTFTRLPGIRAARNIYGNWSTRYALQNSNVSNGVSSAVAKAVTQAVGLPVQRCEVLHLGCEPPKPVSAERLHEYREQLQLSDTSPVVIHIGSFRACKNHVGLLLAFRKIVDMVPDAVLLLVGDGPLRPSVEEQTRHLGLSQHVRVLGTRRDATDLMRLGDLFLFPSLYEGLSVSLMEASALGMPIVASDIPGNREATCDGSSARLHEVTDIDGMARSAVELLGNPGEGRRLGEIGRESFERIFTIQASNERLCDLYGKVLWATSSKASIRAA